MLNIYQSHHNSTRSTIQGTASQDGVLLPSACFSCSSPQCLLLLFFSSVLASPVLLLFLDVRTSVILRPFTKNYETVIVISIYILSALCSGQNKINIQETDTLTAQSNDQSHWVVGTRYIRTMAKYFIAKKLNSPQSEFSYFSALLPGMVQVFSCTQPCNLRQQVWTQKLKLRLTPPVN